MTDPWDSPEGQTQVDMVEEWRARYLDAVARAEALLEVLGQAEALLRYTVEGADAEWPDWEAKFDALKVAVEAARVKRGE